MGINDIQVIFSNSFAAYYSGSKVSATVIVNVDQQKKVREINVKFMGVGRVHWSEFERENRSNDNGQTVNYSAEEILFESRNPLCGEATLPIGKHTFDVAGFLPPNTPGSFEGEHGNIRYSITVTIVRAWSQDEILTVPFTVIYPVEISSCAAAQERLIVEGGETVGCCCWKSGSLSATLHAPLSGYTPQQTIPVTVAMENLSNTNVTEAVCSLDKIITYCARQPASKTKTVTTQVATVQLGQLGANSENTWTRNIVLPNNLHTTNTITSSLIKISYELKLNTTVSKACSYGISLSAPVIICTNTAQRPPMPSSQYAQNPTPGYSPSNPPDYAFVAPAYLPTGPAPSVPLAPPSYEAVAGMPNPIGWTPDYEAVNSAYPPANSYKNLV